MDTVQIPLTRGYVALIDAADMPLVGSVGWAAQPGRSTVYAYGRYGGRVASMHRVLLGLNVGDGKHVDHINGDGLDNRRCNLRVCTNRENQHNRQHHRGTSRYKGVSWHKSGRKWIAAIMPRDGNRKYLGLFQSEESAARAYDAAARELFGEFARCNFAA